MIVVQRTIVKEAGVLFLFFKQQRPNNIRWAGANVKRVTEKKGRHFARMPGALVMYVAPENI